MKCRAITKKNEQCKNDAKPEYSSLYCETHKHLFKEKKNRFFEKKRFFGVVGLLVGALLGAFFSYIISDHFFKKSQEQSQEQLKEQKKQIENLIAEIEKTPDAFSLLTWDIFENIEESDRKKQIDKFYSLTNNNPEVYRDDVCKFYCEYIRRTTRREDYQKKYKEKPSEEIQHIIDLLFVKMFTKTYIKDNQTVSSSVHTFDLCTKDFSGAFLFGANFFCGKLNNVDFSNAKLKDVYFGYADLNNVKFWKADLENVFFDYNSKFGGSNYSSYHKFAKLKDVQFNDAKLNNVDFNSAKLNVVDFSNATLNKARFIFATLNVVNFNNAKFSDIRFKAATLSEVNFKNTRLEKYPYNEITREERSLELTSAIEQVSDALSGVQINGVRWATRNVDELGKFAAKPEDEGKRYQWNRLVVEVARPSHHPRGLNFGYATGYSWTSNYDPSPDGWRVPTIKEIETLLDTNKVSNKWTTLNGIKGRVFTDKTNSNSIFFPAAGYRDPNRDINRDPPEGKLYNIGESGHYWSNTSSGMTNACNLYFSGINAITNISHRGNCMNVRSVKIFATDLQLISLKVNRNLYQDKIASFTIKLKNKSDEAYNSRLWIYMKKLNADSPHQSIGGNEYFIAAGETKTITITGNITLQPDTYSCNVGFDANNNMNNMDKYLFQDVLKIRVTVKTSIG